MPEFHSNLADEAKAIAERFAAATGNAEELAKLERQYGERLVHLKARLAPKESPPAS